MCGKTKILIAEDELEVREFLKMALENRGFIVEEAVNGKEALEKTFQNKPHIIILDGLMPEMDGFEAYRRLRQQTETKDIPIIFCTALPADELDKKGIKANAYLYKPIVIEKICEEINRLLKKKS